MSDIFRTTDDGIVQTYENGHWRHLNLQPPAGEALRLLGTMPRVEDAIPMLTPGQWNDYADVTLEQYSDVLDLDQDGVGSCAWETVASLLMIARQRAGLLHVPLNPWTGYAQTNSRDVGSDIAENVSVAQTTGIVPDAAWPRANHAWRTMPNNYRELAAPYRIDEVFRIETRDELASCLCQGIPVGIGVPWSGGGHAITAVRLERDGILIKNSWGSDWDGGYSKPGYRVLPWRTVDAGLDTFTCVAVRSCVISE